MQKSLHFGSGYFLSQVLNDWKSKWRIDSTEDMLNEHSQVKDLIYVYMQFSVSMVRWNLIKWTTTDGEASVRILQHRHLRLPIHNRMTTVFPCGLLATSTQKDLFLFFASNRKPDHRIWSQNITISSFLVWSNFCTLFGSRSKSQH